MAFRGPILAVTLLACACAPTSEAPTDSLDDPTTAPFDDSDSPNVDDPTEPDPLNLSFEWPRLDVGEQLHPDGWLIDETGDARSVATRDDQDAVEGNQFFVMDIDGSGRTWATSPVFAELVAGQTETITFAMRSDCTGAVITLLAGGSASGFAVLPTAADWSDVSFSLTASADHDGEDFQVELINDASQACSLEIDHIRLR